MTAIGIGFIPLPDSAAAPTRQAARAALNDYAHAEGVALRHVYEPPGTNPDQTRAAMTTLEDVASMHGARTLVIFGAITEEILEMARTAELRLMSVPDVARRRYAIKQPHTPSEPLWLGHIDVELLNGRGWRVRTIDLDVRPTTITLADGDRMLAQLDRLHFHEWLHDSAKPLQAGDSGEVVWFVRDGTMCLDIEGSIPCIVPAQTVAHLVKVI